MTQKIERKGQTLSDQGTQSNRVSISRLNGLNSLSGLVKDSLTAEDVRATFLQ